MFRKNTPRPTASIDISIDEFLFDRLERLRTGANTHIITAIRQSYLGSLVLCKIQNSQPNEMRALMMLR
jgi:hypothetical protein